MTDVQAERCRKRLEQFLADLLEPVGRSERRPLGRRVRTKPAAEWRAEIDRAVSDTTAGGECAGHAAVHRTEPVGVDPGVGAIGKTNDGRTGAGSGMGCRCLLYTS